MELISMVEFVKLVERKSLIYQLKKIRKYAEFLATPLDKKMFIGEDCYFEGFTETGRKHVNNKFIFIGIDFKYGRYKTVEDLTKDDFQGQKVKITKSGIKKIGMQNVL